MKRDILIIGAGPAGMSAAFELANAGERSVILEKDEMIGGLAKTIEFREGVHVFKTDIGPHRFFSKNQYLYDMIASLLGSEWDIVKRKTRQYRDDNSFLFVY